MALTGSLSDMNAIDLVQFPASARKTGELVIAGAEDEARLYYQNGQIHHAVCAKKLGFDAVLKLLSFTEGRFEFRNDITANERSIHVSVSELLVDALYQQPLSEPATPPAGQFSEAQLLKNAVDAVASKHICLMQVALFTLDGNLISNWVREESEQTLSLPVEQIIATLKNYPRQGLNKITFMEETGTIVATLLDDNTVLILSADASASAGMVSLTSNKLTQKFLDFF